MARLTEFAEDTTFHGLVHLVKSTSKIIKIIWITVIVLCIATLLFQIYGLLKDYTDVRSKWTTSIYDELVDNLPVPVVTVCNFNRIKKSKVTELNMTQASMISLFKRFVMQYPTNVDVSAGMDAEFEVWKTKNNITSNHQVFEKMGPQCNETIVSALAYFPGSSICATKVPSARMYVAANPVLSLDMGRCYQMTFMNSSGDGIKTGGAHASATVVFDALVHEYINEIYNNFYDVGLAVQFSFDNKLEIGRWEALRPGQQIWLGGRVSKSKTRQIDKVMFNPPCIKDPKLEMFPDMEYTMDLCKMDVYHAHMSAVMNCTYLLVDSSKYPECNFSSDQFYEKLFEKKSEEDKKEFFSIVEKDIKKKCKEPCDATFIETTITTSQFPAKEQEAKLIEQFSGPGRNLTTGDIGRRLIALTMYWKSFTIRVLERHEKTTIEDLISNIGGQFGLWLGGSMLTITHALLFFCGTRTGQENRKSQISTTELNPKYAKERRRRDSWENSDKHYHRNNKY